MKVGAISASEALSKLGKGAKNTAKKVVDHVKENKEGYIATGVGVGAVGAYGVMLHHALKTSENGNLDYEFVKALPNSGGDYIERVGDHYNLVHLGYDGIGSMTSTIDPAEYAHYGLDPIVPNEVPAAEAVQQSVSDAIADAASNYERVKYIDANNYIERVGDHYNLVHIGYDGIGSMTSPIDPKDYDFYGLKPLEVASMPPVGGGADNITSVLAAAGADDNLKNITGDGIVNVIDGTNWIEKTGDTYSLTHLINGDTAVVKIPINPLDYGITPDLTVDVAQGLGDQVASHAFDAVHVLADFIQ